MERKGAADLFHVEHRPAVLPIEDIVDRTPKIKSFYIDCPEIASASEPGQFLMIWVIGEDEIPMAVSAKREGILEITVEKVGDATSRLHKLQSEDLIGVRGPYGNGYDLSQNKLLIVGGGCGMASLSLAVEEAVAMGKEVNVVLAAKTSEDLLFRPRLESLDLDLILVTEDGSAGVEGLASDGVEKMISEEKFESCLICGPENMMVEVAELVSKEGVPVQVSLNRYVKCGLGICGQCTLDPIGVRVCQEGPVFFYDEIKGSEFGKYRRDAAGVKRNL